jgi:uncharacterized protein YfbU (UPF0304 family)
LKRYHKLFLFPAIIIIIAGFFSGFSEQSLTQTAKSLLEQRTQILQQAFYGQIDREQAEKYLSKIEIYPLLSEDIGNLKDMEDTDQDRVTSMEFLEVTQDEKLFLYVSLHVKIRWHMCGSGEDYINDNEYLVILKSAKDGYKLTRFDPE